ncbi:MAG: NAD(P)-binding domain-containing protein, partial [Ktedonobacteraceae bacterium]|nr:NAD(P)-binding domain-containing protein [Ktedonobacteraceae bacterium]
MDIAVGTVEKARETETPSYDAVVVGAGPYGLSAAAHLHARGLKIAIFGRPMGFWLEHMPEGMRMRSYWWATNLSDPDKKYDLHHYAEATGTFEQDPFWLSTVVDYGLWFQKHAVPIVDETYVTEIVNESGRFEITLADGRVVQSASVVMAVGLAYYTYKPEEYSRLPAEMVSHSTDYGKLDALAGKRVIVVGGG